MKLIAYGIHLIFICRTLVNASETAINNFTIAIERLDKEKATPRFKAGRLARYAVVCSRELGNLAMYYAQRGPVAFLDATKELNLTDVENFCTELDREMLSFLQKCDWSSDTITNFLQEYVHPPNAFIMLSPKQRKEAGKICHNAKSSTECIERTEQRAKELVGDRFDIIIYIMENDFINPDLTLEWKSRRLASMNKQSLERLQSTYKGKDSDELSFKACKAIITQPAVFPDVDKTLSKVSWSEKELLPNALEDLIVEGVIRYLEEIGYEKNHPELQIYFRRKGSNIFRNLNCLTQGPLHGEALAMAIESEICKRAHSGPELVMALQDMPGYEGLLMITSDDEQGLCLEGGSFRESIKKALEKGNGSHREDGATKELFINNFSRSIRRTHGGGHEQFDGLKKTLEQYAQDELQKIIKNYHKPYLLGMVILGKNAFDAVAYTAPEKKIVPQNYLERLQRLLEENKLQDTLPHLKQLFAAKQMSDKAFKLLEKAIIRTVEQLPDQFNPSSGADWNLLSEHLVLLQLVNAPLALYMDFLGRDLVRQQYASANSPELEKAWNAAMEAWKFTGEQLIRLFTLEDAIREAHLLATYYQTVIFNPLLFVEELKKDSTGEAARKLFVDTLRDKIKGVDMSKELNALLQYLFKNPEKLDRTLTQLCYYMKRPADFSKVEETKTIERILVQEEINTNFFEDRIKAALEFKSHETLRVAHEGIKTLADYAAKYKDLVEEKIKI